MWVKDVNEEQLINLDQFGIMQIVGTDTLLGEYSVIVVGVYYLERTTPPEYTLFRGSQRACELYLEDILLHQGGKR